MAASAIVAPLGLQRFDLAKIADNLLRGMASSGHVESFCPDGYRLAYHLPPTKAYLVCRPWRRPRPTQARSRGVTPHATPHKNINGLLCQSFPKGTHLCRHWRDNLDAVAP